SRVPSMQAFQGGCITIALPTIQKDLHISEADIQWPVSIYGLTNGCFLLIGGSAADILGRRTVYIAGTAWLSLWSLVIGFVRTEWLLTVCMGLLGLGYALNTPAGVGILASEFDGIAKQRAFGVLVSDVESSGGVLCQNSSWQSLYWMQAGLALCVLCAAWFSLPRDEVSCGECSILQRLLRKMDWIGAALSTSGLVALTLGFANSQSAPQRWRTPYIPTLLVFGAVLLCLFVAWELRRDKTGEPAMVPPRIFRRSPRFSVVLVVVFALMWVFNALQYFSTLYYQSVLHLSPLRTSIAFLPMTFSGTSYCIIGATLSLKLRPVSVIAGSLILSMVASILFAFIDPTASYWQTVFPVMLFVTASDLSYAVCNIQICAAVDKNDQALAGGLFNVAARLGTSMGVALTATVSTSVINSHSGDLVRGYRVAGWVCAGISLVALLATIICLRELKSSPDARDAKVDGGDIVLRTLGFESPSAVNVDVKDPDLSVQ
ncbi:major facilitator superfamily MFS-1, partial [Exidia glandulosa HHB12029]